MYHINLNGEIFTQNEQFININCNKKNVEKIFTVNKKNQIQNKNIECLVVPSKVYNGYNIKPFILSSVNRDCKDTKCSKGGHHSFQIFPFNLNSNIIYIDTIKPNFFSIVNTINMKSDGKIELLNKKSTINIIKINSLQNNDLISIKKDINGNICNNPNDLTTKSKFTYTQKDIVKTLSYDNNPVIYFFGDYVACDTSQQNNINNLFVYFDYGNKPEELTQCLNKMTFNIVKSGNTKKEFLLPFSVHGTQYNDTISKDFIINFDPRDISPRDGFITIINTQETNILSSSSIYDPTTNENYGSINFNTKILENIEKHKRNCLTINFWLVSFNFQNNTIININDKKGPYKYIKYIGNPKIIIYIPPYILKNDDKTRKKSISSVYQTNENECDIYVNINY